jgi:hypothetical protein
VTRQLIRVEADGATLDMMRIATVGTTSGHELIPRSAFISDRFAFTDRFEIDRIKV